VQGESSCVTLPAIPNPPPDEDNHTPVPALVAQDGGVVFAQWGVNLLRLDFPQ
jgi:hypothetical protein